MTTVTLQVDGDPGPQGSKTFYGRGRVVESSARVKPWRDAVRAACARSKWVTFDSAVSVDITFIVPRPASHYRSGRNAHLLREGAPLYPVSRHVGDLDKLVRSTLDGLTVVHGSMIGLLTDDSLVVDLRAMKRYGDSPGALITITQI